MSFTEQIKKIVKTKIKHILFWSFWIAAGIIFLLLFIYWPRDFSYGRRPIYGLNFSQKYARDLGLDWQETYLAILDELRPQRIRISAHWDLVEKAPGEYDFSDLDWQIEEAKKRNIQVILAVGRRTPRWPECHPPLWEKYLPEDRKQADILKLLEVEIKHFQKFSNIIYWQVENEPLLDVFGDCPPGDFSFLKKEIALVKKMDFRPVVLTDSGELSLWWKLSSQADILGTSMYRTVWNPYWGFSSYPFPPGYYYWKARINQKMFPSLKSVIVTELQGEAWGEGRSLLEMPLSKQLKSMNAQKLKHNIDYARRSGLPEIYVWGAEWWYWLKSKEEESLWRAAQEVFPRRS